MKTALQCHRGGSVMVVDGKGGPDPAERGKEDFRYPDLANCELGSGKMRTTDGPGDPYQVNREKSAIDTLLEQSGLSARRFAELVLAARGERTFRRWLEEGAPTEVEAWARDSVVKLERRGDELHLTIFAPIDARLDRKAAGAGED